MTTDLSKSSDRLDFIRNYCRACDAFEAEVLKVAKSSEKLNHLYTEEKLDDETVDYLLAGNTIASL